MLRLIYLGVLFKWRGRGSWSTLCCGLKGAKAKKDGEEEKKGSWRPDGLRRRLVKQAITPSLVLSSILADIDVAADWYFWVSADFTGTQFEGIEEVALAFAVVGTITWLVLATDALGWLRVYACRNSSLWSTFLLWPLINTFVEDLPQLVITFMTTAFDTVAGTLNIATAAVSLLVKVVEAYGSRADDIPSDFSLIDHEGSSIVQRRMELNDDVKRQKKAIADLTPLIRKVNESPDLPMSMQKAFIFARDHEDYADLMDRVLAIKICGQASVGGTIPKGLGRLIQLTHLTLEKCNLRGPIPAEIGNLRALKTLVLAENELTGPIPIELGKLEALQELRLNNNELDGHIPSSIWNLPALEHLDLSSNNLSIEDGIDGTDGGWLKMVSVAVEVLPVGTKPSAAVDERISKNRRHDLDTTSPPSTKLSSLQGRLGGPASTPKLQAGLAKKLTSVRSCLALPFLRVKA